MPNQQMPLYDEEIWPTTSSDQSMTISTPELSSNRKHDNQTTSAIIKDGNENSKDTDLWRFKPGISESKAAQSSGEQFNENNVKSDATTVSWWAK